MFGHLRLHSVSQLPFRIRFGYIWQNDSPLHGADKTRKEMIRTHLGAILKDSSMRWRIVTVGHVVHTRCVRGADFGVDPISHRRGFSVSSTSRMTAFGNLFLTKQIVGASAVQETHIGIISDRSQRGLLPGDALLAREIAEVLPGSVRSPNLDFAFDYPHSDIGHSFLAVALDRASNQFRIIWI